MRKGADIKAETTEGETALDAALDKEGIALLGLVGPKAFEAQAAKQQQETVEMLRKAGVKPVSRFFLTNVYTGFDQVVNMRAVNTKSAKETRALILNMFDQFQAIGFDNQQMTEAHSQAVKSVTKDG